MASTRILTVDRDHRLYDAPVLGEYDAVIVDERMSSILAGFDYLQPGRLLDDEVRVVSEVAHHVARRREELRTMLRAGGVLVVRLREPSALRCHLADRFQLHSGPLVVRTWDWWEPFIERFNVLRQVERQAVLGGTGERVMVDDPDHCLEPYLRTASYAAVLSDLVFTEPSRAPRRLACNPSDTAVACEFAVGGGLIVVVPADGDLGVLTECVQDLLLLRGAEAADWRVAEEQGLLDAYRDATEQLRRERTVLLTGLRDVRARKDAVLALTEVRRVLSHHRKATAASTSVKDSLVTLYRAVEIIEDHFGGEGAMISALGISKLVVSAVKKPANEKRLEVRHATVGEPEALNDAEVQGALGGAKTIIQAFINHLYEQAAVPTAS